MWIIVAREPRPDAPYWPARRFLAAVDSVAWPLAAICALQWAGESTHLFGSAGAAILTLVGLSRLRTALWFNGRYRFTSWIVLKVFGTLAVLGLFLKLFLH
jgi:hypothetical protein